MKKLGRGHAVCGQQGRDFNLSVWWENSATRNPAHWEAEGGVLGVPRVTRTKVGTGRWGAGACNQVARDRGKLIQQVPRAAVTGCDGSDRPEFAGKMLG